MTSLPLLQFAQRKPSDLPVYLSFLTIMIPPAFVEAKVPQIEADHDLQWRSGSDRQEGSIRASPMKLLTNINPAARQRSFETVVWPWKIIGTDLCTFASSRENGNRSSRRQDIKREAVLRDRKMNDGMRGLGSDMKRKREGRQKIVNRETSGYVWCRKMGIRGLGRQHEEKEW